MIISKPSCTVYIEQNNGYYANASQYIGLIELKRGELGTTAKFAYYPYGATTSLFTISALDLYFSYQRKRVIKCYIGSSLVFVGKIVNFEYDYDKGIIYLAAQSPFAQIANRAIGDSLTRIISPDGTGAIVSGSPTRIRPYKYIEFFANDVANLIRKMSNGSLAINVIGLRNVIERAKNTYLSETYGPTVSAEIPSQDQSGNWITFGMSLPVLINTSVNDKTVAEVLNFLAALAGIEGFYERFLSDGTSELVPSSQAIAQDRGHSFVFWGAPSPNTLEIVESHKTTKPIYDAIEVVSDNIVTPITLTNWAYVPVDVIENDNEKTNLLVMGLEIVYDKTQPAVPWPQNKELIRSLLKACLIREGGTIDLAIPVPPEWMMAMFDNPQKYNIMNVRYEDESLWDLWIQARQFLVENNGDVDFLFSDQNYEGHDDFQLVLVQKLYSRFTAMPWLGFFNFCMRGDNKLRLRLPSWLSGAEIVESFKVTDNYQFGLSAAVISVDSKGNKCVTNIERVSVDQTLGEITLESDAITPTINNVTIGGSTYYLFSMPMVAVTLLVKTGIRAVYRIPLTATDANSPNYNPYIIERKDAKMLVMPGLLASYYSQAGVDMACVDALQYDLTPSDKYDFILRMPQLSSYYYQDAYSYGLNCGALMFSATVSGEETNETTVLFTLDATRISSHGNYFQWLMANLGFTLRQWYNASAIYDSTSLLRWYADNTYSLISTANGSKEEITVKIPYIDTVMNPGDRLAINFGGSTNNFGGSTKNYWAIKQMNVNLEECYTEYSLSQALLDKPEGVELEFRGTIGVGDLKYVI